MDFDHYGLKAGIVFKGTKRASENGCGKWNVLVWNGVSVWRTWRHSPTKNSEEYHPPPPSPGSLYSEELQFVGLLNVIFPLFMYQVIRRSGEDEKILVIAKKRADHVCDASLIVVNIVLWEGISQERANFLYGHLSTLLPQHGVPTVRRCGINET